MSVIDVKKPFEHFHSKYISLRRTEVLAHHVSSLIPRAAGVLDVGCGDGEMASILMKQRSDITLQGLDVLVRPHTRISVQCYDGRTIPFPNASFDVVMLMDVLHHSDDPMILLREAARVMRKVLIIKDHLCESAWDNLTLRFMDTIGNARYGVALPYAYWPKRKWFEAFKILGATICEWKTDLGLYPWPTNWVFERSLHFIVCLKVENFR